MSVEVIHLSKKFGTQAAVDDISFTAKKGQILGFLGPNGAGKTTTMRIISGFLPATSGEIRICGMSVQEQSLDIRRRIGYLPEHNPLYKDMYVREYLEFFAGLCHVRDSKNRIRDVIQQTGLGPEQHKLISSLSKGYKQRVGLCQALLSDPEVLLLDEPTSGLDPNQLIDIRNLIKQIGREKTLIFSTHIMQEVQALCDRVIIINKGRIVADDSIDRLLQKSDSSRIFTIEFANPVSAEQLRASYKNAQVSTGDNKRFELRGSRDFDPRESLFKLATINAWTILELKEEHSSVEDVFSLLTKEK